MKNKLKFNFNIPTKLFAAILLLVVSSLLLMTVTVAWFTLSTSPEIDGMRITVAGNNTIMIAQNQTEINSEGIVINYPGKFSKMGNLDVPKDALLSPTSTADGVNWFIPEITEDGQMKVSSYSDFILDRNLEYANSKDGGYIYVDFWVVSPLNNCYLRLSTGDLDKSEETAEIGSYLVQLPETKKDYVSDSGYILDDTNKSLSSSARVGFLINTEIITTNDEMKTYASSNEYIDDYKKLKGIYGGNEDDYKFMIYEPNGLVHSNEGLSHHLTDDGVQSVLVKNDEYHVTKPIGFDDAGNITSVNVAEKLMVQTGSKWIRDLKNEMVLNTLYQGYLTNPEIQKKSEDASEYYSYIDYSFLPYIDAGHLYENTWDLYMYEEDGIVSKDSLSIMTQNNVITDSHLVVLEKNVPQRIRMFVWMEGQDVDCDVNGSGKSIALRLEFAGSTGK